jgi:hypothetical protein
MVTRNVEALKSERDKERWPEAEPLRLRKIATNNKEARSKGQRVLLSLLVVPILTATAVPALAQPPRDCSLFGLHNGVCSMGKIQKTSSVFRDCSLFGLHNGLCTSFLKRMLD